MDAPQALRVGVAFRQPLDEFPIAEGKQFLFVRGAGGQVHHFAQRFDLLPRALAEDVKGDRQAMQGGVFRHRPGLAGHAQAGARGIQMGGRAGEKPVFQALHQVLFLFRLLDFGKSGRVGVRKQLGGERTAGAQKQDGRFFQALFAPGREHARPPIVAGEILARQGKLLKIILQQQPGALRVVAVGEDVEDFRRARRRRPWSRPIRGAGRPGRRRFWPAPCGGRRIWSCCPNRRRPAFFAKFWT